MLYPSPTINHIYNTNSLFLRNDGYIFLIDFLFLNTSSRLHHTKRMFINSPYKLKDYICLEAMSQHINEYSSKLLQNKKEWIQPKSSGFKREDLVLQVSILNKNIIIKIL